MITRVVIAAVAASLVIPFAFGQMKYSRPRSTPTPTPSPTPQATTTPASNQRKTFSPVTYAQPKPTASVPLIPAQKIGARSVQPQQTPTPGQRNVTTAIQPNQGQRTLTGPVQSNQPTMPTQRMATGPRQPMFAATPAPIPSKPTPTPVPPPDVKSYLDKQLASSKDQKFHMTVNGKDLALTPFHVWMQRSTGPDTTSTIITMRSDEGRVYDIDFMTTGAQVSSIRIHRVNGESVR